MTDHSEEATIEPVSGPEEAHPGPEYDDPDDEYDYEGQDFSALKTRRVADVTMFGVRFRFAEPSDYQEAWSLVTTPADGPEALCRRSLAVLVERPDPLGPVLEDMEPWQLATVAAEALSWVKIGEYIDEVESIRKIRAGAAEAFAENPPTADEF